MHPELAPVAFIAAFSLFLPLPWHWRTGNIATLAIIAWLFVTNMIYAVDAVIWAGSVDIIAPVWCDISTKLIVGASFALPAACLCISIHLEQVSSLRIVHNRIVDKRRRQYFEALSCFGFPMVFMALHYIVQGHRFDVVEDYGCRPTIYFSILAIFIIWIPPILIAVGSLIYAGLALRHFIRGRLSFTNHLQSQTSALTTSRYLRLISMSALLMVLSILLTSYTLWFNFISLPIRPWTTWQDVHFNFSRIQLFPAALLTRLVLKTYYILWWFIPAMTFLFVAFFSFGKDAMDEYKRCFLWINKHVFCRASPFKRGLKILPSSKNDCSFPVSRSTIVSSSSTTNFTTTPTSPSSFNKSHIISMTEYENDSEASYYSPPPLKETSVLGSYNNLSSPYTPSAAVPSYEDVNDMKTNPNPNPPHNIPSSPFSSNNSLSRESGNTETPLFYTTTNISVP